MEVRSGTIRRALLFIVGGVFCYVFFYNSLLIDRRPIGKLIQGVPVYESSGRSADNPVQPGPTLSPSQSPSGDLAMARSGNAPKAPVPTHASGSRLLEGMPPAIDKSKSGVPETHNLTKEHKNTTARPVKIAQGGGTTKANTVKVSEGSFLAYGDPIESMFEAGFRIANKDLCPERGQSQLIVILITTAPGHDRQRRAIRQTWGSIALRRDVSLAFVVGRTKSEQELLLDSEQATYGDLIQTNVVDAYRNLTLKTVAMLQWLDEYCAEAKLVLKTDDDMFINTDNLLAFVKAHKLDQNVIYGRLGHRWKPIRNKKSKYFLDTDNYPGKYFPDFLTGPAYVFSGDLIERLYSETMKTAFLPLEDVLVTGVVGEKLKVKRINSREFINDRIRIDTCKLQTAISIHMVKFDEQFDMWKRVSDGRTKCSKTYKPTIG